MKQALLVALIAVFAGTGCSTLYKPAGPPPPQPTVSEMDTNGDNQVTIEEQEAAKSLYEAALKAWQEGPVEANPAIEGGIQAAGAVASAFVGPIGSTVASLLAGLFAFSARTINRKRKQAEKTSRVVIDSVKDLLATVEKSNLGAEGVEKLKELLRKKQINAGVYDDVKQVLNNL